MGKKLTTEQFIEKARLVHGDKHDKYTETNTTILKSIIRDGMKKYVSYVQNTESSGKRLTTIVKVIIVLYVRLKIKPIQRSNLLNPHKKSMVIGMIIPLLNIRIAKQK